MEQARGKIEGVPDVVAARYAVTEPQLLNTPTSSSGLTMTKFTGETSKSTHPDYPRHLEGEGSFGLGQMLPREVMFPDMIKQFDKMPAYKDQPDRWIRALHTHPPTIGRLRAAGDAAVGRHDFEIHGERRQDGTDRRV